jgi:CDP-Glycerol:Poly(glycerophosphate) glycerophosphotransferase
VKGAATVGSVVQRAHDPVETRTDTVRTSGTRRVWLVFADQLTTRIFVDCGILDGLRRALPGRLSAVFLVHEKHVLPWRDRLDGIETVDLDELMPMDVPLREKVTRRVDIELEKRIGFYPRAIRHSQRHGFHDGRWAPGHVYPFLDTNRAGPLPRWRTVDDAVTSWHFSRRRYVPSALLRRMRQECDAVVLTNPQTDASTPFLTAARRLGLPTVGYIASWDHPVGKGVVSPYLDAYVVQNETMRSDLQRFHAIDGERVAVTGWPQTDLYHRRRPRSAYEQLLVRLRLPVDRPVVLYAGNSPHNMPYEPNLVARLVSWWRESGSNERLSLLFRPHPYDDQVNERFRAALDDPDAVVQERSWTDLEDLATLLQHVDCVVANAGTIMLEALVNDRPSVCVTFDEGAPEGRSWADLNLTGEHYRKLLESDAFLRADSFDELVAAVGRSLQQPGELASERARVAREVVGVVDGRATERVVDAICEALKEKHHVQAARS